MKHNITDLGIPAESELRGIGIIGRTKAVAKFNWSGHIDHDNHVSQAVAKRLRAQTDGSHPDHEPDTGI